MALRIGLLGAGSHSLHNHIPALAEFQRRRPGLVELAALCDWREAYARDVAGAYAFQAVYTDLKTMLTQARLDACITVTPVESNARLAAQVIRAGLPVLMEKPPGSTPEEARQLAVLAERSGLPVMVSMNRRFDPALLAGLAWRGSRPLHFLRAVQARHARRESEFMVGTAIHTVDAVRALAGEINSWSAQVLLVEGVNWYTAQLDFESGMRGAIEIMPTAGVVQEQYELYGPGYHLHIRVGGMDRGEALAWDKGELVLEARPAQDEPAFIANGTYAETDAFLMAVLEGSPVSPTPGEVLGSVEICHAIFAQSAGM